MKKLLILFLLFFCELTHGLIQSPIWSPMPSPKWEWGPRKKNSAGILPYAFDENGKPYFLLAKQRRPIRLGQIKTTKRKWEKAFNTSINKTIYRTVWSDFGDQAAKRSFFEFKKKGEEEPDETAIRSFIIQSNAFFWRQKQTPKNTAPLADLIKKRYWDNHFYIFNKITGLSQQMGRQHKAPEKPPAYWLYFAKFKKHNPKNFHQNKNSAKEIRWISVENLMRKIRNEKDFYGVVYPFDNDKTPLYVGTLEKLRQPDSQAFIAEKLKSPEKSTQQKKSKPRITPIKDPLEEALKDLNIHLTKLKNNL